MNYATRLVAPLVLATALAACGGAEDRKAEYLKKGNDLFAAENYEKARLEFKNVLQIDPKDVDGRFMLAQTLEKLQQWRGAVGHYKAVVEQAPEHTEARTALAKLYLVGGAPDQALELAEEVLALDPENADAYVIKAGVRARQDDMAAARENAEAALARDPDHPAGLALMASIEMRDGNKQAAEELLKRGIAANPDNTALRLSLANLYAQSERVEEAGRVLEEMVALRPDDFGAKVRLGAFFARTGNVAKAREVLEQAVVDHPDELAPKLALVELVAESEDVAAGIAVMEGYVEAAPDNHELRLTMAKLYERTDSRDQALAAYREVVDRDGEGVHGLKARNALARLALGSKDFDQARVLVEEVLAENPKDADALALRGDLAMLEGDAPSAIADYRAVLRGEPDNARVLRALASAHRLNDEQDLAQEAMAKAVAAAPEDLRNRFALAEMLVRAGDTKGAQEQLEAVLEIDPTHAEALEGLVKLHMSRNEADIAGQYVERYVQAYPERPQGHYFAGLLHQARGDTEAGIAAFEESLIRGPEASQPLTAVIKSYLVEQDYDAALERLDQAIADNPDNPLPYNLRGEVLLLQKDYSRAAEAFGEALDRNDKLVAAHRNLALALFAKGDREGAVEAFKSGIEVTGSPLLKVGLAGLYEGLGRPDAAIEVYEEAVAATPDSPAVANNLAMLLVSYRDDAASLSRAAELAKLLEGSEQAAYLDTVGWVSYKQGEYEEAVEVLRRAVEKAPESAEMNFHLGMALLKTGDREGARAHLEKAMAKNVNFREAELAEQALAELAEG